ncbi:Eukaryotic translation initiation factor 5 [Blattella germanica]|nr:Eukaryotic translation initiation factor 5 [Blattella germanica]
MTHVTITVEYSILISSDEEFVPDPTKYFGCELGAQTQFDFKNDRFIVNGSHDATKLQDLLDGFIRKFVLCPECDNPETTLTVSQRKSTINQACKAYLNPAAQGSSLTEGKRGRRSKKANGESNGTEDGHPSDNDSSDHVVEAPEKIADDDGDNENWAVEVSEEAVRARLQELTDGAKGMTITDDLEKTEKERMDLLYEFIKTRRDSGQLLQINVHKELVTEAERLEIKSKAPLVLAELLFDQNIHTQVKKYRILFLRFTHEDPKAQKYLLGGIEQVIALHKDMLLPKVPGIFKMFYDADILEENVLLEWATKVSKKYVSRELSQEIHNKAEPFIKWLKEAEEEDDSYSDDDEEDDDLEASPLKEQPKQAPTKKPMVEADDEEDDLDIDAI